MGYHYELQNELLGHGGNGFTILTVPLYVGSQSFLYNLLAMSISYIVVNFGDDLYSRMLSAGQNVKSDLDPIQVKVMGQGLRYSFPHSALICHTI